MHFLKIKWVSYAFNKGGVTTNKSTKRFKSISFSNIFYLLSQSFNLQYIYGNVKIFIKIESIVYKFYLSQSKIDKIL